MAQLALRYVDPLSLRRLLPAHPVAIAHAVRDWPVNPVFEFLPIATHRSVLAVAAPTGVRAQPPTTILLAYH